MKKYLITLAASAAIFALVGFWFGGDVLKTMFPQFYVNRAVSNTARDIRPQTGELGDLARQILAGSWRQDLTFGFNDQLTTGWFAVDQSYNDIFRMFTFNNTTIRDRRQDAFFNAAAINMSGDPIINLDIYLDRETTAVNFPQAYDNFIFANTRTLASDYAASAFGGGNVEDLSEYDDEIFEALIEFLFDADFLSNQGGRAEIDIFEVSFDEFIQSINFQFGGRDMGQDIFEITIPGEAINDLIAELLAPFMEEFIYTSLPRDIRWWLDDLHTIAVDGDLEISMYISGGRVRSAEFVVRLVAEDEYVSIEGSIQFEGSYVEYHMLFIPDDYSDDTFILHGEFAFDTTNRLYYNFSLSAEHWDDDELQSKSTIQLMLDWGIYQEEGDNFAFTLEFSDWHSRWASGSHNIINMEGYLRAQPRARQIVANFSDISIMDYRLNQISELIYEEDLRSMFSFSLQYVLQQYDGTIPFDIATSTALADLTEEDIEAMEERLIAWAEEMEEKMEEKIGL